MRLFPFLLTYLIIFASISPVLADSTITPIVSTFLSSDTRSGLPSASAPGELQVLWKTRLGCGKTKVGKVTKTWCGAGWTGQPLLIEENKKLYLIQGAYDHSIRKIDAATGRVIWRAPMPDVVKGTPTYWENKTETDPARRYQIIAGSRAGDTSLRSLSYLTGRELWAFTPTRTASYSRDVDGSPLVIGTKVFANLENGFLAIFDATNISTWPYKGHHRPKMTQAIKLFGQKDPALHRGNLVTESSPALFGNMLAIAAGSGHVYFFDVTDGGIRLIWDYFVGSDIDGSPVFDAQGYAYVTVEKEYIAGPGGVLKLDPRTKRVVWFFPTGNRRFADWDGGVVGSVAIDEKRKLVYVAAIDGYLYSLDQIDLDEDMAIGPDGKTKFPMPWRH